MEDYRVVIQDLPYGIKGFILLDADDFATIVINAHYSQRDQQRTFQHEYRHLRRNDAYNSRSIRSVESA